MNDHADIETRLTGTLTHRYEATVEGCRVFPGDVVVLPTGCPGDLKSVRWTVREVKCVPILGAKGMVFRPEKVLFDNGVEWSYSHVFEYVVERSPFHDQLTRHSDPKDSIDIDPQI